MMVLVAEWVLKQDGCLLSLHPSPPSGLLLWKPGSLLLRPAELSMGGGALHSPRKAKWDRSDFFIMLIFSHLKNKVKTIRMGNKLKIEYKQKQMNNSISN